MWTIIIAAQLGILSILDIRKKCVPVIGVIELLFTVLILQFFDPAELWEYIICILVGVTFLLVSKLSKEAIGYGDSLVILILGIQLGFWKFVELLTYSMFLLGVASLIILVLKGNRKKVGVPFVPMLAAGYLLTVYT